MPDWILGEGRKGERVFALIEILVAISIISIGLLGLAGAMSVQSGGLSSATATGHAAVTRGYYVSTAILLAQERMEQVKHLSYKVGPPAVDEIGSLVPTTLPDEAYGAIAGYENFSRQIRVENYPSSNVKTITVTVTFKVPTATSVNTESVVLSTLIAARP